MTETEARERARKQWGDDVPANGQPARSFGAVYDDGTAFGRRFKVGIWTRETPNVGCFTPYGEGGSWEAAFDDADRRRGSHRKP